MPSRKSVTKEFTYTWAFEPFLAETTFFQKRMFGGLAAYVHQRLMMVLVESPGEQVYRGKDYGTDLWHGVLLPTEHEYHEAIKQEFPSLKQHPVLKKWLYAATDEPDFESTVTAIAEKISEDDKRFGVYPKQK